MQIALGPLLYFWPKEDVYSFYGRMIDADIERVYLGETVCAKRRQLKLADWLAIGRDLCAAGKEVVLSTLTLIESKSDLLQLEKICNNGEFLLEANDMAAVQQLAKQQLTFVAGPALNIYGSSVKSVGHFRLR